MITASEKDYTLNDVCEILKIDAHSIRHWQNELDIKVCRNEFNQRVYTRDNIETFRWVIELRKEGLNIKSIKKVLSCARVISESQEEVAAATDVVPVNNGYITAMNAIIKFKTDLVEDISNVIEIREQKLYHRIDNLEDKIDYLEKERNYKLDLVISEWRERNKKKSILSHIFK